MEFYEKPDIEDCLAHFGVKGMKWGVRRYQNKDGSLTPAGKKRQEKQERKQTKKELESFSNKLVKSGNAQSLATASAIAKFDPKDYDKATDLIDQGRLVVKTKLMVNLKEKSIDVYIGKDATPTMRAKMKDSEHFVAEFLNKADQMNYDNFVKFHNEKLKRQLL